MLKVNLLKSFKYGIVITLISPFLGWIKVIPFDPEIPILPVPLQILRIFIISYAISFCINIIFNLIKEKIKNYDKN